MKQSIIIESVEVQLNGDSGIGFGYFSRWAVLITDGESRYPRCIKRAYLNLTSLSSPWATDSAPTLLSFLTHLLVILIYIFLIEV